MSAEAQSPYRKRGLLFRRWRELWDNDDAEDRPF
jgi:hypothetical protein